MHNIVENIDPAVFSQRNRVEDINFLGCQGPDLDDDNKPAP